MIVGESIRIQGTIEGEEDLVVRGRVEGTVRIQGALTVEPGGWVVADVHARTAIVHGTLRGNVSAREAIEVARTGRMVGDAVAPQVTIVRGAGFRGRVEMGEEPAADEPPRAAAPSPVASRPPVAPAPPAASGPPAARTIPRLARLQGPLRRGAAS